MAFIAKTKINTYDVEAYRVVETVVFQKPSGCGGKGHLGVHTNDLPSKDLAGTQGARFNPIATVVGPDATKSPSIQATQPDGTILITPVPDLPAYDDLVGAPLAAWVTLPEGKSLEEMSLHELVFLLAYQVARLDPQTRDATDA